MAATWPFRRMGGRWRLNKVIVWLLVAALVLSLTVFKRTDVPGAAIRRRPAGNTKPETAQAEPGCSHVYRLSSVSYRLEETWPDVAGCVAPLLTPALLRRCVAERAHRRRRPTSILLLGDSRMRILYHHLADELGVPTPPDDTNRYPGWQKGIRWDNSPERWCRVCPWHCCPRAATAAGVSLRFEWLPFWTEAMVTELEATADRCERGEDDCPDLVLLNGALWYMKAMLKVNAWNGKIAQLLLLLRLQLARAAAALARLAVLTRTIWKLDEGMPYDVRSPLHGASPAAIPIVHSLVYDAARKIPGLVVWTSALPESSGFLRRKCYSLQGREDPDGPAESPVILVGGHASKGGIINNETFIHECGKESLHPSKAVMTKAIHVMFAELCSGDLYLAALKHENEYGTVQLPICCSENTLTAAL